MAKKRGGTIERLDAHTTPDWPTASKLRYADGRVVAVTGGVWLYKKVPLAPVVDARTDEEALAAGYALANAFQELAATSRYSLRRRSVARSTYREVHLLLVNLRRHYSPPRGSRHAETLRTWFGKEIVQDRVLLFGVRLRDEVGGMDRSWADVLDSAAMTMTTAEVPITDYDRDFQEMDSTLSRVGFETPTPADFSLAESWWAAGDTPEASMVNHADHIHVFRTTAGARVAAEAGPEDCRPWPTSIEGHNVLRMASIHDFDLPFISNTNTISQWVPSLLRRRAVAVSLRGKVEPSQVTRAELRRQRGNYTQDIRERHAQGKMSDQEQEEMLATLQSVEGAYASGNAAPTLVETSVIAAFSGPGTENVSALGNGTCYKVSPMSHRQEFALPETWIASPVRSNPNLMDLPSTAIAYSGLPSLARVGDASGAHVGFTINDRQPALMSATKSADEDHYPLGAVVGSSGSGKAVPLNAPIPTPTGWTTMGALRVGDQVLGRDGRAVEVSFKSAHTMRDLYRLHLGDGQKADADFEHQWIVSARADRDRADASRAKALAAWERAHEIAGVLDALAGDHPAGRTASAGGLAELITRAVPDAPYGSAAAVIASLRMMDCEPVPGGGSTTVRFPVTVALRALAERVRQQHAVLPASDVFERRMTTGEMIAAGVLTGDGSANFAIRLAEPLDLPTVDLAADPYALGADYARGFATAQDLAAVARGSYGQRLGAVQGVMDILGRITDEGRCQVAVVADDAPALIELIRSLGILVREPDERGQSRLIEFTTDRHVFADAEKLALLPQRLPQSEQWLAIEKIEKIPDALGACITVDSADRTYLVYGMIPTSNTIALQFLGHQYAEEGRPVIVIDPKRGSDLSGAFKNPSVFSLDSFAGGRNGEEGVGGTGIFDPLRFSPNPSDGVNTAVSMLHFADIWPFSAAQNFEADLKIALNYGVRKGHKSIGTALKRALDDEVPGATEEMIVPILRQSEVDPMFGACVGLTDEGEMLRAAEGLTYIKVGNADLELPPQGVDQRNLSLPQRISVALVRMMVFGSASALFGRRGVLMLDEAWVFLGAGAEQVEQLGRLARSQEVYPIMFTQRISDVLEAHLENHIARGIILHTRDPKEARAAFELFRVDATEERLRFTTAMDQTGRKPVFQQMPDGTRVLVRGSVGLYCDMDERAVDVELRVPEDYLKVASTNALDRAAREGRTVF